MELKYLCKWLTWGVMIISLLGMIPIVLWSGSMEIKQVSIYLISLCIIFLITIFILISLMKEKRRKNIRKKEKKEINPEPDRFF